MGEEKKGPCAVWRFGDSPFAWGGVGVVVGSALVSPAWFTFAFVGGGIAIGIGLLRAGAFKGRSIIFRVVANVLLLSCLGVGWRLLWKVIPKPVEPLTKQDAQELLSKAASTNRSQAVPPAVPLKDAAEPITKAEFLTMLQQYESPTSAQNKFEHITNARISDMARAIAINLQQLAGRWRAEDHDAYMSVWDPVLGSNSTSELRAAAPSLSAAKQKRVAERYVPRAKELTAQANECRLEILSRLLPSQKNFEQDKTGKASYDKILGSGNAFVPNDLDSAASYLDDLRQRLP